MLITMKGLPFIGVVGCMRESMRIMRRKERGIRYIRMAIFMLESIIRIRNMGEVPSSGSLCVNI